MITESRDERLKQIRQRAQTQRATVYVQDVTFLLSLLDSQPLTGFGKPEDEARRILTYAKDWIGDANYRVLHTEIVKSVAGLYSELDRITKERDDLRLVVEAATDDDPATALSKLHKIQHVAATRMRNACLQRVRDLADDWLKQAIKEKDAERSSNLRLSYNVARTIIETLELVTLQEQERGQPCTTRKN